MILIFFLLGFVGYLFYSHKKTEITYQDSQFRVTKEVAILTIERHLCDHPEDEYKVKDLLEELKKNPEDQVGHRHKVVLLVEYSSLLAGAKNV